MTGGRRRALIIGAVAAGSKAAATAHRRDPDLDVVVLQEEPEIAYSSCGLPYHLADPDAVPRARLVARTPERFRSDGIDLRTGQHVEELDVAAGEIRATDLSTGRSYREPFDSLLVATGAEPISIPLVASAGSPVVTPLRSLYDLDRVMATLPSVGHVVILGCGYIGLEAAEAFRHRGVAVAIVEKQDRILPSFEADLADLVLAELRAAGCEVFLGDGIVGIGDGAAILESSLRLTADLIISAVGIRPRVSLARASGLAIGPTGAIGVDDRMETSEPGVFAAGDCTEATHRITGSPVWLPLGDVANRQGRVAGTNLAGGDARFPGVLGTAIFRVVSLSVGRTGLAPSEAEGAGLEPVTARITAPSQARYMPGSVALEMLLVADRGSGRLLGAQVVGRDGADKAIDIIATAIWGGLGIDDLADVDLAYAPPYSPVFAPVQVAAEVLRGQGLDRSQA